MRIAIFSDTYTPHVNGVAISTARFVERLAKRGHEFRVYVPKYKDFKDKKVKNITIRRSNAIDVASDSNGSKICLPKVREILKEIEEFKPDVIHLHTPFSLPWVGMHASKKFGIPHISTYHTHLPDLLVYARPTNLLKLDKLGPKIRETALGKEISDFFCGLYNTFQSIPGHPHPALGMTWAFTRLIYNKANCVLSPTQLLKDKLIEHGITKPIQVLSNGIEFNSIAKKKGNKRTNNIIHAGRLGPEKRIDVVVKAMAEVVKKEPKAKLHIFGPGPAKEFLSGLINELKLNKNIVLHGPLPRPKLLKEYHKYDFFVTASPMETQGIVLLEAMAAGIPALGIKKLAVGEVIEPGKNGFLAPPFSHKKLAEHMLNVLLDDKLREKLSKGALITAAKHDIEASTIRLEGIYEKVSNDKHL